MAEHQECDLHFSCTLPTLYVKIRHPKSKLSLGIVIRHQPQMRRITADGFQLVYVNVNSQGTK